MPKPKVWDSAEHLVADLKEDWRARAFEPIDWEATIANSVGNNTFRAFRNLPKKPSRVFRDWAYDALVTRGFLEGLKSVRTQDDYDLWLSDLVRDLTKRWKRQMAVNIPFGPSYKLPNLLMKGVSQRLAPAQCKRITKFLHVALDSYTLAGIRNFVRLSDDARISTTASMGSISNKKDYDAVQAGIRILAKRAGVPPIAYDYLAWDQSH